MFKRYTRGLFIVFASKCINAFTFKRIIKIGFVVCVIWGILAMVDSYNAYREANPKPISVASPRYIYTSGYLFQLKELSSGRAEFHMLCIADRDWWGYVDSEHYEMTRQALIKGKRVTVKTTGCLDNLVSIIPIPE